MAPSLLSHPSVYPLPYLSLSHIRHGRRLTRATIVRWPYAALHELLSVSSVDRAAAMLACRHRHTTPITYCSG